MDVFIRIRTNDDPKYDQMKVKDILPIAKDIVRHGMEVHPQGDVFRDAPIEVSAVPLR